MSFIAATLIALLLFSLMQYLISRKTAKEILSVYSPVEVFYTEPVNVKDPQKQIPETEKLVAHQNKPMVMSKLFDFKMPSPSFPEVDINTDNIKLVQKLSGIMDPLSAGVIVKGADGLSAGSLHALTDGQGSGKFELGGRAPYHDMVIIPHGTHMPPYPDLAAREKIEGWVLVEYTITEKGWVQDVIVLDADPKGVFEETTVKTVYQWKYRALPVSVRASQHIEFTLDQLGFYHRPVLNEK
jgi:TonB family protein